MMTYLTWQRVRPQPSERPIKKGLYRLVPIKQSSRSRFESKLSGREKLDIKFPRSQLSSPRVGRVTRRNTDEAFPAAQVTSESHFGKMKRRNFLDQSRSSPTTTTTTTTTGTLSRHSHLNNDQYPIGRRRPTYWVIRIKRHKKVDSLILAHLTHDILFLLDSVLI